jgi:choice-of-anchor B domain-containing protein
MKKCLFSLRILLVIASGICAQANAHIDHDKARFVSSDGRDSGDCKNRFRPCASIGYAAQKANKGDIVLVAQGNYELQNFSDIFYLISDIVPAYGGFQTLDNYQAQNPNAFPTNLVGVPVEYAQVLTDKGFNVIVDSKGISENTGSNASLAQRDAFNASMAKVDAMYTAQAELECVDGTAGEFGCNNISLLAHVPLTELSSSASLGNDIWGHVDLNTMKEYAIIGTRSSIALVDVSDPVNPVVINNISGQRTTWRDIKVYQFYSEDMNKWQAYAYATADSASEGLTIMNLSNPDEGLVLVDRDTTDRSAHNIYLSNVDYGLNIQNTEALPQVHILGSSNGGGSLRSYSLATPADLIATHRLAGAQRSDYSHDASSLLVSDERAERDCIRATSAGCTVMLDFNEGTLRLWDHSSLNTAFELSSVSYPNANYTHSGWWTEDRQYVLLHDELDEQNANLNTTVHIFDISDLNNPTLVSTWTGPTAAIDHNGFVRGNKYYMSNYERGVTILDISDPLAPAELGHFDTFPARTANTFNGAWGTYPFLPSGIILVSDIQGGLYILKDETQSAAKDDISFSSSTYSVQEGSSLDILVNRASVNDGQNGDSSGEVSVDYHIINGSTDANDFSELRSGTLTWAADDTDPKAITISPLDDETGENTESMFIRLENVSANAEIMTPNITKVDVLSNTARASLVALNSNEFTVKETDTSVSVTVTRSGASDTAASVSIGVNSSSDQNEAAELGTDATLSTTTLSWAAGEVGDRNFTINIINDSDTENEETLSLVINNPENVTIEGNSIINLTIRDDESNAAPIVNTEATLNVIERQTVTMVATASDPEAQEMTFAWSQTSGTTVSLNDASDLSTSFTAPEGAATLAFTFTATDDFGVESSAAVTVNVEEDATIVIPPQPPVIPEPPESSGSSGGVLWWLNIMLILTIFVRRKYKSTSINRV